MMRFLLLSFVTGFLSICSVAAQPVHPYILLQQPSPQSTNALGALQDASEPLIGLYLSREAVRADESLGERLEDSIRQWEFLLIGLELPYVLLTDSLFNQPAVTAFEVLIVPTPELLPDSSLRIITDYVEGGGALIASGYSGLQSGNEKGWMPVKQMAGIEELVDAGRETGSVRHKIVGGHPIGHNIPLGFELDLLSDKAVFGARTGSGEPIGYTVIGGELQDYTCITSNRYGDGRVVWIGFSPQDIPPNDIQQRRYQELVLDALVYAAGVPHATIRRWPNGFQSASSFVQLPSSGYQPFAYRTSTDLLLNVFEAQKKAATFFVVLEHARDHPDLLERMTNQGELGLVSNSPQPLSGLTEELQYERLSRSKRVLEEEYGKPLKGALPPGYFYDANTLRVLSRLGIQYVLSDAKHFQEPVFLPWETELDYRDSLVVRIKDDSLGVHALESKSPELIRIYPTLYSYDIDAPLSDQESERLASFSFDDQWRFRMNAAFDEVHGAGGLFTFGFEPESMGLSEQRARVLAAFIGSLADRNTWTASLTDIVGWWRNREHLTVTLEEATESKTALRIENRGEEVLDGVSINLYQPGLNLLEADLVAGELDVFVSEQGEGEYLIGIRTLGSGTHEVSWVVDPADGSDQSEP